jgi:hypothetical protein
MGCSLAVSLTLVGENWKDFAAGVAGGVAGLIIGQPLDIARVSPLAATEEGEWS